ncbi:MBL fold metallo-hydrolase [Streptomyces sp. NPDC021225]|uniref:MBL fold metallo-hydrolase n=1 Tax=Streptomyces sp. NPDC021225 TaxID=3365121 RepID=UPI00379EC452
MSATALHALDGAHLYMAAGDVMVDGSGIRDLSVPTFLIEHEQGLVLIDTGLAPESFGGPEYGREAVYGDIRDFAIARCERGKSVIDQLATVGKRPEDVTHVVLTHDHFDHTGGLPHFPQAILHIGRADWENVQGECFNACWRDERQVVRAASAVVALVRV